MYFSKFYNSLEHSLEENGFVDVSDKVYLMTSKWLKYYQDNNDLVFSFDIDVNDSKIWVVGHWSEPMAYDSLIDVIKEFVVHYL